MEITIRSDVFGLSSTKHLRRNAEMHPGNDLVIMRWLCHLISQWGVGLNTSDLTQRSGLITRIASDLVRRAKKYSCTVRSIIGLRQKRKVLHPHRKEKRKVLHLAWNTIGSQGNPCTVHWSIKIIFDKNFYIFKKTNVGGWELIAATLWQSCIYLEERSEEIPPGLMSPSVCLSVCLEYQNT
jgi:hypothetical protein